MDKRALLSILAVSTIASATPGFQLGLGLGTLQTDMTPEHLGLESHLGCLLYTSPSPRDRTRSRMPSSA